MCCEIYAKFTRNQCAPRPAKQAQPPDTSAGELRRGSPSGMARARTATSSRLVSFSLSRRMFTVRERGKTTTRWIWEDDEAPWPFRTGWLYRSRGSGKGHRGRLRRPSRRGYCCGHGAASEHSKGSARADDPDGRARHRQDNVHAV